MFNNPMNYELLKSVQEEMESDAGEPKETSIGPTVVKALVALSGLAVVAIALIEMIVA